jgi:hypothetical protein
MQLPAEEFIRRFLLHVLPPGFMRIRHYGFLSNRTRPAELDIISAPSQQSPTASEEPTSTDTGYWALLATGQRRLV